MKDNKKPFMPEAETQYLTKAYEQARVILEYGSGGSTRLAAAMKGKYIMSVESDLEWTRGLRRELAGSPSPVSLLHVNIGKTGSWGRPLDDRSWRAYHSYPNAVWDESWFRDPDLVLIDGRFRTACLATILLRARKPIRVLFDDYVIRPKYRLIERVIKPRLLVGRMGVFDVVPATVQPADIGFLIAQYSSMTTHGAGETAYNISPNNSEHMIGR